MEELRSESINSDSMEELRQIFDLCDEFNQGFIPVKSFIQVFKRHLVQPDSEVNPDDTDGTDSSGSKKMNESTLSNEEEERLIKFFDPDSDGLMSFADFVKGVEILRTKEAAEKSGDTTYESFSSNGSDNCDTSFDDVSFSS